MGDDGFRDRLLNLLNPVNAKGRSGSSHSGGESAARDLGFAAAERIIARVAAEIGLPESAAELAVLPKGEPRKVICAALVKARTAVPNGWLATRLAMGHPASMSKHGHSLRRSPAGVKTLKRYKKMLKSTDCYHFRARF